MEEHHPLIPRIIERAFEFVDIVQDAKPALGVGVLKGIGSFGSNLKRDLWFLSNR